MDAMAWPLILCSQESLYTRGSIECRRCHRELAGGDCTEGDIDLDALLRLVRQHATECPACT